MCCIGYNYTGTKTRITTLIQSRKRFETIIRNDVLLYSLLRHDADDSLMASRNQTISSKQLWGVLRGTEGDSKMNNRYLGRLTNNAKDQLQELGKQFGNSYVLCMSQVQFTTLTINRIFRRETRYLSLISNEKYRQLDIFWTISISKVTPWISKRRRPLICTLCILKKMSATFQLQ